MTPARTDHGVVPMVTATVRERRDEEGWGVLDSPETPGGCWGHYSAIQMDGFRTLSPGQRVDTSSGKPPASSRTGTTTGP
jgi:CspA family cold shock protein